MPYANEYNAQVARTVNSINQGKINLEKVVSDNVKHYDVASPVEAMVLKEPDVKGGSGYAAATFQDLGFEPTLGATSVEKPPKVRKKRRRTGYYWRRHLRRGSLCGGRLRKCQEKPVQERGGCFINPAAHL